MLISDHLCTFILHVRSLYLHVTSTGFKVEELIPVQPGVRASGNGLDDLHDGDGQPAPGGELHASGPERAAWPVHPQPGLLPALHPSSGTGTGNQEAPEGEWYRMAMVTNTLVP